jgi:hypothetical protein
MWFAERKAYRSHQATAPNIASAPAVTAIAMATQKAARQVPLHSGAPPMRSPL